MNYPKPPENIIEFSRSFSTEQACADYLFSLRWPHGYVCPKCGSSKAGPIRSTPGMMECENHHKISVTAGTALHRTKQSLTTWFHGAWLVATHKSGISAVQFQRQLGLSRLETAWTMLHKLRAGLVDPDRSKLNSFCADPTHSEHWVEVDQIEVGGVQSRADRDARGSNKAIVMVAVEVHKWNGQMHRDASKSRSADAWHTKAGRIRMRVIPTHGSVDALNFLRDHVATGSRVVTDAHASFNLAGALGWEHEFIVSKASKDPLATHGRVTTNLKRWLLGTHKGSVQAQHLQAYLNEYVFRFNRRDLPWVAFNRVLALVALAQPALEYKGLYKHTWLHPNPASNWRPTGR
jgi:hypothetical protein